jgi:hypothetical protein
LCNAIERIFGILKRRFPILAQSPEYPFETQVKLVFALTGLQNFIRQNSIESETEIWEEEIVEEATSVYTDTLFEQYDEEIVENKGSGGRVDKDKMSKVREEIAGKIWYDYQKYRQR